MIHEYMACNRDHRNQGIVGFSPTCDLHSIRYFNFNGSFGEMVDVGSRTFICDSDNDERGGGHKNQKAQ